MSPTLHVMKSKCPLGSSRDSSVSRAPPRAVSAAVALSPHLPGHPWGPTLLLWALQGCIPPPQPVPCSCPLGTQPTSGVPTTLGCSSPPWGAPTPSGDSSYLGVLQSTSGCSSPPRGAPTPSGDSSHLRVLQPPWETPATLGAPAPLGVSQPPWGTLTTSGCSSYLKVFQPPQGAPATSGCSSHLGML